MHWLSAVTDAMLVVVVVVIAARDVRRGREVAELQGRLRPFADVVAAAVSCYELRQRGRARIEDELQAEKNLFAKVRTLLNWTDRDP